MTTEKKGGRGRDYEISREKFEPEPGFEPRTSGLWVLFSINNLIGRDCFK